VSAPTLRTERLVLRPWRDDDHGAYAALNADPVVMEHFPSVLSAEQSVAHATSVAVRLQRQGWGLWAVEVPGRADFIGFIGLSEPHFEAHFTPAVEIGWRLARAHWGRGYAPEGAAACLRFAFDELGLDEVVSFTSTTNLASQRVMQKLGMVRDPADDFDHPSLPEGHQLRRHVLYRLSAVRWRTQGAGRPPELRG
jgi:RimJ/RimL family protein N-acetyltransferase